MSDVRFETSPDTMNDCLTLTDNKDELKTEFGSDIVLSPLTDAKIVVNQLNKYQVIVEALTNELIDSNYYHRDDVLYLIKEALEDME